MFDVFYLGKKPGVFVHERAADSIEHARQLCTTRYFWWVTYLADYSGWDFLWEPVPWQANQIHTWPSQWHEYSGTYLVPKEPTDQLNFHSEIVPNQSQQENWLVLHDIDENIWDWSWSPHPLDPPYIYVFGNQWWPGEIMPTVEYHVPGATERKYMDLPTKLISNKTHWTVPDSIDPDSVDYTWVPHPGDPPFIYEFATQWQPNGGARYHVPGATERKYVDLQHHYKSNSTLWQIPDNVDPHSVDTSWHPSNTEQPYIYEFATQWQPNGGARYVMPGATEIKYVDIQHHRLPDKQPWKNLEAVAKFDYSWHPDNTAEPYNYVFGNQHWPGNIMPTVIYCVPGATQETFVEDPVAHLWSCMGNWELCEDIDDSEWDWTWVPNPKDPPFIYQFGNQWNPPEFKASLRYHVPGATDIKYMDPRTRRLPNSGDQWRVHINIEEFDYSWEPNPFDPPYIYVFGNQWNSAVLEPTVAYHVPGATERKYVDDITARVAPNPAAFELIDDIEEFDYSWRPNPTDPPYIYVFGNQWLTPEQRPALQYRVGNATEIKYMDQPKARRRGNPELFQTHRACDFDWSWEPDPGSPPYNYVFGNQWHSAEVMPTIEYHMPGATEIKYMDAPVAKLPENPNRPWYNAVESNMDYSWVPDPGDPPYIYVFGNQWHSAEVMPTVEYRMPGATERKYVDSPIAELPVDMALWHIPDNVDITDMDFSWVPDPGSPPYIYQFATQHQKTGGPQYRMLDATEVKYVDMMRAEVTAEAVPVVEIDHLDGNAGLILNTVKRIRYFDNYRDTLIRLAKSLVGEHEHVWVCSSVCDYTDFDFSWHPEKWQSTMLHVFPSNTQKFGDTFYMHVPTFADRAEKKQLLEWYSVNYVSRRPVPRRLMPVIVHDADSHVDVVKSQDFVGPLATFTNHDYVPGNLVTVPLWRQETKTIVPISSGAGSVVVPKVAVPFIKTQLYDYPHIDKTQRVLKDTPLDIVFISNGEINADRHFAHLASATCNLKNKLHRVDGVNGRVAAYHAAAQVSGTPWFFAVFAKLQVNKEFDWNWQPDRMQQAKHYIFHAENPLNGLVYGHQAMIAYNKKLVLENKGLGLDFTLDQPHEVVPILSGTAWYTDSPWMAWRTAFREVIKLMTTLPDVESEYRLNKWLDVDSDEADPQWSRLGAEDAEEYYNSVNGDFAELRKSYDWAWLASYAFMRRNLTTDQ
jgi:hypothetical protein